MTMMTIRLGYDVRGMPTLLRVREVRVRPRRGLCKYLEVVSRALPSRPNPREAHVGRTNRPDICVHSFSRGSIWNGLIYWNHGWDVFPIDNSDAILEPRVVLCIPQYLG